jgi:hypothetical protein
MEKEVRIFIIGTNFSVGRKFDGEHVTFQIYYGPNEILGNVNQRTKYDFLLKLEKWANVRKPLTRKLLRKYLLKKSEKLFNINGRIDTTVKYPKINYE